MIIIAQIENMEAIDRAINRAWDFGILGVIILGIFAVWILWLWRYHIPNKLNDEEHRRTEETKLNDHQRDLEITRADETKHVLAVFTESITEATAILKQLKENENEAKSDRANILTHVESIRDSLDSLS